MRESTEAEQNGSHKLPLAIIIPLAIVLSATIAILTILLSGADPPWRRAARDDPELPLIIQTRTPSLTSLPTSTRQQIATPTPALGAAATATRTPKPSAAATSTPAATPTATATATLVPTHTPPPTATPTQTATPPPPTPTPHAIVIGDTVPLRAGPMRKYDVVGQARQGDALPVVGRTGDGKWLQVSHAGQPAWIQAELLETADAVDQVPVVRPKDFPPTPTPAPTRAPSAAQTLNRVPRPILVEPRNGARFGDKVRFKFSWVRRLEQDERISIYIRTADDTNHFDWWVSEADILNGGGAIHEEADGVVYEVNSGFGPLPPGRAFWKVAVCLDSPAEKRQVSPWSMERRIVRR